MRACTAVVTELRYNCAEDEDQRYRAEIHFITTEDWVNELKILFDNVLAPDGQRLDSNCAFADTEAGIAYSKIRAVYPQLTRDSIVTKKCTLENLAGEADVKELLGDVAKVSAPTPDAFGELLLKYIDSKGKTLGCGKDPEAMEYWPLIKVVKIFVKATILESGLVLVDMVCNMLLISSWIMS
jgi:hypothetical protein